MSVRVGHIMKNEDVHGVSGIGKVADVFEASNGKCILVWDSAHSSVGVFDHIKDLERTHSHGGKTLVVWDWESAPDPDPMDKLNGQSPTLTDAAIEAIANAAASEALSKATEKVSELIAEKVAEKVEDESPEKPEKKERGPKKATPKPRSASAKKKEPKK